MSLRKLAHSALGAVVMLAGLSAAQADEPIERSGNAYHRAVCGRAIGRQEARCMAHERVDAFGNEMVGKPDAAAANVVPAGYGPNDLRQAYGVTVSGSATTTIAIVDAYGYSNAESDLAVYRKQFGLPACTTANGCFKKVNQNGVAASYPRGNNGWAQEQALDLDMASAMCPNCKILLVQANSATYADLATAVNTAAALGAKVISNSYGGGELGSTAYAAAYNKANVAVTASTGDAGYGVSFPATATGVIAVGGTTMVRTAGGRGFSETAWASGGSGCSTVYGKPTWQGVASNGLCTMRMGADIAAVGDPATGVAVYGPNSTGRGAWLVFGGTSVSAPVIGGIYGAYGILPSSGAQKIWTTAASAAAPGSMTDVTVGANGSCGGSYFCTARAGYDGPTGWGTPYGPAGL